MKDLEQSLAALARPAPAAVVAHVLEATGTGEEYTVVDGPTGPLYVAWNHRGIVACVPLVAAPGGFETWRPGPTRRVDEPPRRLAGRLRRALESGRLGDLPVDLEGVGEFQRLVLRACAAIPPGEVRPYGWIAREIGRPRSARAVGSALARNPVPILVPCHRVVRTDGRIGRYAFGTEMKRRLLAAEGIEPDDIEALARRGVRYVGSRTTAIFCFPTCRHARRVADEHRVAFRDEEEALAAGYTPCSRCRPAAA